jgi:hypothetical protein
VALPTAIDHRGLEVAVFTEPSFTRPWLVSILLIILALVLLVVL